MPIQPVSYTEDLTYASYIDRLLIKSLGVQSGAVEASDLFVFAGSGLQVNVEKGKYCVEQTGAIEESSNNFFNGMYNVLNSTEAIPYNNVEVSSVNPQIAQIILRVYDVEELKISGQSFARLEWLNGAPSSLATKAKMEEEIYEGVAAVPQSSAVLARVLVPKNATSSSEYYIEDNRSFSDRFPLTMKERSGNVNVKLGEFALLSQENKVARIPVGLPINSVVGVYNGSGGTIELNTGGVVQFYGDFITGGTTLKLASGQHVILHRQSNAYWFIIAGEPKREQLYKQIKVGAGFIISKAEMEAGFAIPSTRPCLATIQATERAGTAAEFTVGGKSAGQLNVVDASGSESGSAFGVPCTTYVPPGQLIKALKPCLMWYIEQ